MNQLKKMIRKNKTLVEILIGFIGIVMILVSANLQNEYVKSVLSGIGTSLLASAIVVFVTLLFLGDGEEDQYGLKMWGMEAIYSTRGEMNASCDKYLKKAKTIDVVAFGLKSWRDSQSKLIEQLLKRGCAIRILTMNPDCLNLKQREKDEGQGEGSIGHTITQLIDWAKNMNSRNRKGKIEIKCHSAQPLDFIFLMDNRLFVGPYEYGKGSQQTISYEFNTDGKAYIYFKDYFDELWENEKFAKKIV